MEFVIKGGCLYPAAQPEGSPLAASKTRSAAASGTSWGRAGLLPLRAVIQADPSGQARQYLLLRPDGTPAAIARPGYAPGEGPRLAGLAGQPSPPHRSRRPCAAGRSLRSRNAQQPELRAAQRSRQLPEWCCTAAFWAAGTCAARFICPPKSCAGFWCSVSILTVKTSF